MTAADALILAMPLGAGLALWAAICTVWAGIRERDAKRWRRRQFAALVRLEELRDELTAERHSRDTLIVRMARRDQLSDERLELAQGLSLLAGVRLDNEKAKARAFADTQVETGTH